MSDQQGQQQTERATYLTLIGLFAAFSKREQDRHRRLELSALDLAMLGLATFRAGRLAAFD